MRNKFFSNNSIQQTSTTDTKIHTGLMNRLNAQKLYTNNNSFFKDTLFLNQKIKNANMPVSYDQNTKSSDIDLIN